MNSIWRDLAYRTSANSYVVVSADVSVGGLISYSAQGTADSRTNRCSLRETSPTPIIFLVSRMLIRIRGVAYKFLHWVCALPKA